MNNTQPSVLSAAWRYRVLILVVTAVVVAIAAIFLLLRNDQDSFRAKTSVLLQEPVSSDGLVSTEVAGGRFVASQVEIMDSPVVAAEAANLLAEEGFEVDGDTVSAVTSIISSTDSPLVTITAFDLQPERAVAIANAVAEGYRNVSSLQATATAQSQLAQLQAQLDGIRERLDAISAELDSGDAEDPGLTRIREQAQEAIERIPELQDELVDASTDDAVVIRRQIQDYRDRIDVYQQVVTAGARTTDQSTLLEEQSLLLNRRSQLLDLRDQISIEAELAPDALALIQAAELAEPVPSAGATRTLGVAGILGLALGAALAYFLAVSRRSFSTRVEPEEVLEAPLLADIPDFAEEGLDSAIPVRDNPRSAAAEAFRFAASSLAVSARSRGMKSLAFVSATQGQGKTTSVVNTALAAAVHGSSILVIDSDFGNQASSRVLLGGGSDSQPGMTDVVEGVASMDQAIQRVELGDGVSLDVLARGTRPTTAAMSLQSNAATELFKTMAERYDLVIVDTPPMLQVAYASRIVEMVEGAVVVIEHQSPYREAVDMVDRIGLIGRAIVGYVYNRSALRREMTMTEGSMMDIIGDGGFSDTASSRRSARRRDR